MGKRAGRCEKEGTGRGEGERNRDKGWKRGLKG